MNRRGFTVNGVMGLAGVMIPRYSAALPAAISLMSGWQETHSTSNLAISLMNKFGPVIRENTVKAMTAEEWQHLSYMLRRFGDEHSRLGNLHRIDITLWQYRRELELKGFDHNARRIALEYGSHYVIEQSADLFMSVGIMLGTVKPVRCDWDVWAVGLGVIGAAFALDPITAPGAPVIAGAGLVAGVIGLFLC